jgi:hypothetical protein
MKTLVAAIAGVLMLSASAASATNLCNCCGSGTAESCQAACQTVKPAEGMCLPVVDYQGKATIAAGRNPLYDVPLRGLSLEGTKRGDFEVFRRLLERARKGVETDRRSALRNFRRGRIDASAASAAAKRYNDAIVNYYLGMHAYRDAVRK